MRALTCAVAVCNSMLSTVGVSPVVDLRGLLDLLCCTPDRGQMPIEMGCSTSLVAPRRHCDQSQPSQTPKQSSSRAIAVKFVRIAQVIEQCRNLRAERHS